MQVLPLFTRTGFNPNCEEKSTPKDDCIKACAKKADLVLVIGTSLSGLASDCVPEVILLFRVLLLLNEALNDNYHKFIQ